MDAEAQAEGTEKSAPGNGTSDDASYWHSIDWVKTERNVKRLRQRIFKAAQQGNLKRVRNLQKLMLRSHSNTLQSVKRVTQTSTGRRTAGIDGETVLKPRGKGRGLPHDRVTSELACLVGQVGRMSLCPSLIRKS
ncbi:reverse transcriptase N-terminal domain-containing protein, partial [Streptomyces sp. NPDC048258]|uniref:reverse transcriptase N-terminal domain-containing protein n=1 Tax=Streptomyces sp. NPDC048258 TaxID=3365527 RepID=UPI00371A9357